MTFPVEEKTGEIKALLAANREVVLVAPPGSGKTTCVAPALLGERWLGGRKIVMLEPRRIAARSCAAFMADKMGETPGGTIGYQVRLERKTSRSTKIEIVTEGLLAQRMLSDPELADTGLLIFDEFHERSLACDLAFAMAVEVKRALRPDLRLIVMSATLDPEEAAKSLDNPCVVRAEGRMHPVETIYLGDVPVAAAARRALAETEGDVLCFLPGEGEIRRAAAALESAGCEAAVLQLYGSMPKDEQDRVFKPAGRRKIILATSIAETSLTIPGITAVVDSGLMRTSRFSPSTGMDGMATLPLPLDRACQRAGRAGRVAPGKCYRLWDEAAPRPEKSSPEILYADLAGTVLSCAAWGARSRDALPWATMPPAASWDAAKTLLTELGALDAEGGPTEKGLAMAALPMHPRLAAMMLAAKKAGGETTRTAALLAAIVEETRAGTETDIRKTLDDVLANPTRPSCKRLPRLAERFAGRRDGESAVAEHGKAEVSEGALLAIAYPDRIAANRGNGTFTMTCGRGAEIDRRDPLAKEPFLVCCTLDDRQGNAKIFLACPVERREIEDLFQRSIRRERICEWDRRADRIRSSMRTMIGKMPLDEKNGETAPAEEMAAALAEGIRIKGVANLPGWTKQSLQTRDRIAFLARECGWPAPDDGKIAAATATLAAGATRWSDLAKVDMENVLDTFLAAEGFSRRTLDSLAPARIRIPSGSAPAVDYSGDEPTLSAKLQECFGMTETPKVAGGKVPVVMTLLSPAMRPVQTTKDLKSFWESGYALVRKDLRGRYPRHYWPEDPSSATPTRRVRPENERKAAK